MVSSEILDVPVAKVRPLADQPRKHFDADALDALADSLRSIGQLTAVQVVRLPPGGEHDYELIEGERRLRVFRREGWQTIRAEVKQVSSRNDHWVQSFVANMGREGYTPMESARGLQRMCAMEPYASMQITRRNEAIAKACGRSSTWVHQHLDFLKLDETVQGMMEPGAKFPLRASAATLIARNVEGKDRQLRVAKRIVEGELTGARARIAIREAALLSQPVGPGRGRGRRPSDDIAIVERAAARLEMSLDVINSIPKSAFDRFVENAGAQKIRDLRHRIERVGAELEIIADAMAKLDDGDDRQQEEAG
jgi:ParB family transcriptional regulator, chromosome partitioning protein